MPLEAGPASFALASGLGINDTQNFADDPFPVIGVVSPDSGGDTGVQVTIEHHRIYFLQGCLYRINLVNDIDTVGPFGHHVFYALHVPFDTLQAIDNFCSFLIHKGNLSLTTLPHPHGGGVIVDLNFITKGSGCQGYGLRSLAVATSNLQKADVETKGVICKSKRGKLKLPRRFFAMACC